MIRFDCRHYRASRPCTFNKRVGAECPTCTYYAPYRDRILFIKLDAIGDVLRSASMLPVIATQYKQPYIAWLTRPELVELVQMMPLVDEVIALSDDAIPHIATGAWREIISLSNDVASASLAAFAGSPVIGFTMQRGVIAASNAAAETWLQMAAFDRLKQANTQSYQQHMLAILGADHDTLERPRLTVPPAALQRARDRCTTVFANSRKPKIAVNVGAGARWPKKMLTASQIARVIRMVAAEIDAEFLLVGGAAEQTKAAEVAAQTDGLAHLFLTPDSIVEFAAILHQAQVLLCGDTLALHVATAIDLPTVAVFGPTSRTEIADFGLISKFSAALDCLGCYGDCAKTQNCMAMIDLPDIVAGIVNRLATTNRQDSKV